MNQKIKALVFDAYGTLFDPYSVASVCEETFPSYGARLSQLWRAKQLEYTWLRSLMGHYEDFWQITESALVFACKTLRLQCDLPTRGRLMEAYLKIDLYPDVQETLSNLSGHALAILSNGTLRMLQGVVQTAGLKRVFSHVISVDEVRIYKPSPRTYKVAADKIGLDRGAIGFISSNSWDVIGAKAYGFWTCWVNRSDACPDELGFTSNVTVSKLTELTLVLPRS